MKFANYNHRDFSRCENNRKSIYFRKTVPIDMLKNICMEHGEN